MIKTELKPKRLVLMRGDCLEKLKELPDNSVDSLVTDPPAGISFMGKAWDDDKGGRDEWIKWLSEVMQECHRVLKPGAHGLVWSLPRTSHWTAMALELAGFEVRDCVTHLFGQGFPKSLNISKAIDKAAGAEREVVGINEDYLRRKPNGMKTAGASSYNYSKNQTETDARITAPATDSAKQWQGWGTALKPSAEFWWLIRKPCSEKTVAANVQKWGTGGINIDASRIGFSSESDKAKVLDPVDGTQGYKHHAGAMTGMIKRMDVGNPQGRFPANLVLSHSPSCTEDACDMFDCAVAALDEQSGQLSQCGGPKKTTNKDGMFGIGTPGVIYKEDSRGASRFFYCAKISSGERNAGLEGLEVKNVWTDSRRSNSNDIMTMKRVNARTGELEDRKAPTRSANTHPTVKPKKLMGYLINLITPPNGVVLDPFMGSGSTGLACKEHKFKFIGIEKESEYFEIAKARIISAGRTE